MGHIFLTMPWVILPGAAPSGDLYRPCTKRQRDWLLWFLLIMLHSSLLGALELVYRIAAAKMQPKTVLDNRDYFADLRRPYSDN